VELTIEDVASDGFGIARLDGKVVRVEAALTGDRVLAQIHRIKSRWMQARVLEVLTPSHDRITPVCMHYDSCGGCRLQHASYEAQLLYKQKQVTDAMERIGQIEIGEIRPILGAPAPYFYRNKLEFTFSNKRWLTEEEIRSSEVFERSALGFHVPKAFDKIVEIEQCHLLDDRHNAIRNAVRAYAREHHLSFYDIKAHTGLLRNLVIRTANGTEDFMVILITAEDDTEHVNALLTHLSESFPFVTEWIWIVNTKLNDSYSDQEYRVWKGKGYIEEQMEGWKFRIGPLSFFQTNAVQAQNLFEIVREALSGKVPLLYDLYCGAGTIGIYVSDLAEKIVGVEYVEQAIADAQVNCALNGLDHLHFEVGDLGKMFDSAFVERNGRPDAVIVDPPRAGMAAAVVEQLLQLAPERIVYVSCNPATQARDLALMNELYQVDWIQPVDMFPQTLHVENLALLTRRK